MEAEREFMHRGGAPFRAHELEVSLAALATRQHGVVSRAQLVALGFGRGAIARRVANGRLQRLRPAVYAVGHRALKEEAHWLAAVLASGQGAVLSHRSAAALWGLRPDHRSQIDVSVPRVHGLGSATVRIHRRRDLRPEEVVVRSGVPVSSLPLTLLDFAADAGRRATERASDQAEVLRLYDHRAVEEILHRRAGHRGAGILRAVVSEHAIGTTVTRSRLEEHFLALVRRAGVVQPEMNEYAQGASGEHHLVDALWRAARVVVETDSRHFHLTPAAFENDRRRDADLTAAGYRVLRFTWRQLNREPYTVVSALRACLRA